MLTQSYSAQVNNNDCLNPVYEWSLEGNNLGITQGARNASLYTLTIDPDIYVSDTANVLLTVTCLGCSKQARYPILTNILGNGGCEFNDEF